MPLITLTTNLPESKLLADFDTEFINFLAGVYSKPAGNFVLVVEPNKRLTIGGSHDPAVLLVVRFLFISMNYFRANVWVFTMTRRISNSREKFQNLSIRNWASPTTV